MSSSPDRSRRFLSVLTASALLFAPLETQAGPNLVQNGNFATNGGAGQLTVNTSLANWTGGGKEGNFGSSTTPPVFVYPSGTYAATGDAFMGTVSFYGVNATTPPPDGGTFIAADGDPAWKGSLAQTIGGLKAGDQYSLTFNWAGAQQTGFSGNTTEDWQVTFGTTQSTSVVNTPSQTFAGWMGASMNFTATSTSQLLNFVAIGSPSGEPPWLLLDNVQLTDVTPATVPEPSSVVMLVLGIVAVVAVGLRRRARGLAV